ncbi:MAG: matrixin family metalloprotease [Candidatus Bathyarchaeota archaeon]|nr:matrixin family metalloprotease [Candidatus Bathyarchaeota archaeon]
MKAKIVFFLLLFLLSPFEIVAPPVSAQTSNVYTLNLQAFAWDHATLKVLLMPPENETWWNPVFVNSTLRAIGQWNDAISFFAANYSQYTYLSSLKLSVTVNAERLPNFDVYVTWSKSSISNVTNDIGLTRVFYDTRQKVDYATINLAVNTQLGTTLSDGDVQNVALHEMGHALCLGHSNYTRDAMYAVYFDFGGSLSVSTLDCLGVATVFGWLKDQANFYPVNSWLNQNNIAVSSNDFIYLPVSTQNLNPKVSATDSVVNIFIAALLFLSRPEVLAILIISIVLAIIIIIFKQNKPNKPNEAILSSNH